MLTNREVRRVLNFLSKRKYKKSYHLINTKQQALVRKIAVKVFTKK